MRFQPLQWHECLGVSLSVSPPKPNNHHLTLHEAMPYARHQIHAADLAAAVEQSAAVRTINCKYIAYG